MVNLQRKGDSHRTSRINNLVLYITLQEDTSYRDTAQSNPLMPLAHGNNLSCISPMSPVINNARKVHNRRSEKVRTYPIPYYNLLGTIHIIHIQGSPKESFPGLENFVAAVAYNYCLNLSATFSQPSNLGMTPLAMPEHHFRSMTLCKVQFALRGLPLEFCKF